MSRGGVGVLCTALPTRPKHAACRTFFFFFFPCPTTAPLQCESNRTFTLRRHGSQFSGAFTGSVFSAKTPECCLSVKKGLNSKRLLLQPAFFFFHFHFKNIWLFIYDFFFFLLGIWHLNAKLLLLFILQQDELWCVQANHQRFYFFTNCSATLKDSEKKHNTQWIRNNGLHIKSIQITHGLWKLFFLFSLFKVCFCLLLAFLSRSQILHWFSAPKISHWSKSCCYYRKMPTIEQPGIELYIIWNNSFWLSASARILLQSTTVKKAKLLATIKNYFYMYQCFYNVYIVLLQIQKTALHKSTIHRLL